MSANQVIALRHLCHLIGRLPCRSHYSVVMEKRSERAAVVQLHLAGATVSESLHTLKWSRRRKDFVNRTIQRYSETLTLSDRPRPGRPRSVRTGQLLKTVAQKVHRNPLRSMRGMARAANVSKSSMHRLLREDLHLKAFKRFWNA